MMRLLADECCHGDLVQMLRDAGLDVLAVGEDHPSLDDAGILDVAVGQERLIITDDKDFGALVVGTRPAFHRSDPLANP